MVIKNEQFVFPFHRIPKGKKVVIWGAGNVGKSYIQQILATSYCELGGIIDTFARIGATLFSVPVCSPNEYPWDKSAIYVIAISNQESAEIIRNILLSFGIEDGHIVREINRYIDKRLIDDELFYLPSREFIESIPHILKIHRMKDQKYVRIGGGHDDGYVMIDDFHTDGIAYSFGINDDVSWDFDMGYMGYDVYMYDHTITHLPYDIPQFHFWKKGIAGYAETENLLFLDTFLRINGHHEYENMILKMDVEGAEWDFINRTEKHIFSKFKQMVFEFHGFLNGNLEKKIVSALKKLNTTHQVAHVHGNNYSREIKIRDASFPDALEVTYVRTGAYAIENSNVILPLPEDAPCCECDRDVVLGRLFS